MAVATILLAALPMDLAASVIVSGVDFLPDFLLSSDPNRSQLVVRGGHVVFNDRDLRARQADLPHRRRGDAAGEGPRRAAVARDTRRLRLRIVRLRGLPLDARRLVEHRARPHERLPAPGDIAVDDASVYFVTKTTSPNTWTIRRVSVSGGRSRPSSRRARRCAGSPPTARTSTGWRSSGQMRRPRAACGGSRSVEARRSTWPSACGRCAAGWYCRAPTSSSPTRTTSTPLGSTGLRSRAAAP